MNQNPDAVKILDVKVDDVTLRESVRFIERLLSDKSKPHYVVTINPEFIVAAAKDQQFKEILNNADLSIPDGIGLLWAAKILGKNLRERVTGVDLVKELSKLSQEKGFRIMFFGGESGVADKTVECLQSEYPNMRAYSDSGPLNVSQETNQEKSRYFKKIKKFSPDILLVAFGHPKQEKWIARNLREFNIPISIGVGGAFNYLCGKSKRSPLWIRKLGLEWLYRLITEPYRWKRQIALIKFIFLVLKQKLNPSPNTN